MTQWARIGHRPQAHIPKFLGARPVALSPRMIERNFTWIEKKPSSVEVSKFAVARNKNMEP